MDLATAVVSLTVGGLAVLPRVQALSRRGRVRASIQRDTELWAALQPGATRDRLGADIDRQTQALLDERSRDTTVQAGWLYGTTLVVVGWTLLVIGSALDADEEWSSSLRYVLERVGAVAGILGFFFLAVTFALGVWLALLRVRERWRARHRESSPTYEI